MHVIIRWFCFALKCLEINGYDRFMQQNEKSNNGSIGFIRLLMNGNPVS